MSLIIFCKFLGDDPQIKNQLDLAKKYSFFLYIKKATFCLSVSSYKVRRKK